MRDEDLDRAPAEGEWPLREVLAHLLGAEHGFLAVSRFALTRHRAGTYAGQTEDEFVAFRVPYAMPAGAASGGVSDIRSSFFTQHARVLRELADVADAELELPARFWEDRDMPISFRLHRFEEHLRQTPSSSTRRSSRSGGRRPRPTASCGTSTTRSPTSRRSPGRESPNGAPSPVSSRAGRPRSRSYDPRSTPASIQPMTRAARLVAYAIAPDLRASWTSGFDALCAAPPV